MSRAIRGAIAKVFIVEAASAALSRAPEAAHLQPSLLWMEEESARVVVELAKMTQRPDRTIRKVQAIIDHVKGLKEYVEAPAPDAKPAPHSDVYLAAANTMLLDDIYVTLRDPAKIRLIEPLHQAAVSVEEALDHDCSLIDVRREADNFIAAVYQRIEEAV